MRDARPMTLHDPRAFAPTAADPRWPLIQARDKAADGRFWYSVLTTGVYCRPSCPSRGARPENVAIHDTLEAARATGFRPCKRCRPESPPAGEAQAARIVQACRMIDESESPPSLAALAAAVGLSPGHLHRRFRAATGVTPKAYAAARRVERLRAELSVGQPITQALYGAGFGSSSRLYESSAQTLGMTPGRYRDGGARETLRFAVGQSSLGAVLTASSARGVAAILLGDDPDALVQTLQRRFPRAELVGGDRAYEAHMAAVVALVEHPGQALDLPLDIRGTAFQRRVWKALQAIPPGATASYAEIAERVGAPKASRAVAAACAANALAVAIPCHRVVRRSGELSGYRWGVERKRALLDREASSQSG